MKNIKVIVIAACLTILFPVILFAQTQTAYDTSKDPKYNLGQGSNINFDLNFRIGTNGAHIYFGTQSVTGIGTVGVTVGSSSAAPQIEITPFIAGSTTFNIKNMHVKVDGSELMTTGAGIASVSGSGSDTTLTNPTFSGTGHLSSGFTLTADGNTISDAEIKQLDGILNPIQTQLDERLGTSTSRIGAIVCGTNTTANTIGSTTVEFEGGGDIGQTLTDDGDGHFTLRTTLSGTPTAKPDILEGSSTVGYSSGEINFNGDDFDLTQEGSRTTIAKAAVFGGMYRTTSYEIAANNTWYNLGFDGTTTSSGVTYGTATIQVSTAGTYLIGCHLGFRDCIYGAARLIKNWATEIPGSNLAANTQNVTYIEDGLTILTQLAANDTVGLQVGCDTTAGNPEIDVVDTANLPNPTTTVRATLTLTRLGN